MSKQGENYSFINSVLRRIKRWGTKKSLATALGVLVFAVAMWGMSAEIILAATNPAINMLQATATKVGEATAAIGVILAILVLLKGILTLGLGIIGGFLDFAFNLNTVINPGQLAIVQYGWTLLRDLANGIFILLLLWIAITIVFNLDGLNGKKLLVRVIMVALLINFSLVMVSTVFAFGNELTKPFAKAMGALPTCTTTPCEKPRTTLSQLIVNNSQIHETTKVIVDEGAIERAQKELEAVSKQPPTSVEPSTGEAQSTFRSIGNYLGAPPTAHAAAFLVPLLVQLGWVAAGVIASALATSLAFVGAHALGIDDWVFRSVFNLVIANTFLFLTISAMFTAAVVLLLRLVAMVFLGVFAPIAFLGLAFPKYGNLAWSKWIDNLVRWTFTAPIFYFLLYLSLLMLQANRSGGEAVFKEIPFTANFFKMLNLLLFLIFLWAAVYITKKTAGHFADVALSLGRKGLGFGLGVATGFMARGATSMTRRGAPAIEKVLGGAARISALKPLRTRFRTIMADQRKQVDAESSRLKGLGLTPDQLVQEHDGSISAATKVAAGQLLAEKGKYDLLGGRGQRTLDLAAQYGADPVMSIFKTNPGLATLALWKKITPDSPATNAAEAQEELLKKVNPSDAEKMSDKAFDDTALVAAMWKQFEPEHIKRIARSDRPHLIQKMVHQLNTNPAVAPSINERMRQYLASNAAQELGLRTPATGAPTGTGATPPNIAPINPPVGYIGRNYNLSLNASGGNGIYTWRVVAGSSLPAGLALDSNTGLISGSPTSAGTYTFSIETESGGVVSPPRSFTITMNP